MVLTLSIKGSLFLRIFYEYTGFIAAQSYESIR